MLGEKSPSIRKVNMLNKNTLIGKMISKDRVVFQCIRCINYKFIGDINTPIKICPACKSVDTIVIVDNLLVINK
jgi:Zn finger protein HypA/HybF involved in hydrogenase expression